GLLAAGALDYGESVRRTLFEHAQCRSLIEALDDAFECGAFQSFIEYAGHLTELMHQHLEKEEEVLFPAAERLLTGEQDARLAAELERADREAGDTRRRLTETVARLVRLYVGDSARGRS